MTVVVVVMVMLMVVMVMGMGMVMGIYSLPVRVKRGKNRGPNGDINDTHHGKGRDGAKLRWVGRALRTQAPYYLLLRERFQ